jgi:predicted PurR-regulated permease PerM
MYRSERISYLFMVAMLLLIGWLHMATLLLTTMFSYFALRKLSFGRHKALGIALFLLLLAVVGSGLYYFSKQAYVAAPNIAETTIPAVAEYAEQKGLELPFWDYASLKALALEEVKERLANVGRYAKVALFQVAYLVIGAVVAISLFLNARFHTAGDPHTASHNLYTATVQQITIRFRTFYRSFATVMGAQILISAINSVLTALFLFGAGFPHAPVLIIFTFLCGLLPILGNIISYTLITGVAFTLSPQMALIALLFLIAIHKLEYVLNSKIIGHRIRNAMWLTLLALLLGEKLMGIPGMILAPVVLHYIKVEASRAKIAAGVELAPVEEEEEPAEIRP